MDSEGIKIDPEAPQVSVPVWRGHGWRDLAHSLTWIGLLLLAAPGIALLAFGGERFFWLGLALVPAGIVVAWLRRPLGRLGRETWRLGIDPAEDRLLTTRGRKGATAVAEGASRVVAFEVGRHEGDMGGSFHLGRQHTWVLRARRRDRDEATPVNELCVFAGRRDARRALRRARRLLPYLESLARTSPPRSAEANRGSPPDPRHDRGP